MKKRQRIFICYRREGGAEMARLVRDGLKERGFDVFMDVEDFKSGQFNQELLREIESASDVVVILSAGGLDRCFQEGDWLRWEIAHAISCQKNVVPVVTRGFAWPTQPLPEDLKQLPYYQALEPSHSLFRASIDKLVTLLKARPSLWSARRTQQSLTLAFLGIMAIMIVWLLSHRGEPPPSIDRTPPEKPDRQGWVRLFDGKTLSCWTAPDPGEWRIKDGVLIDQGPASHLFSPYSYTNLEFKSDIRLTHGGNSGMFFRAALGKGMPQGYEAQAENTAHDPQRTGSLIGFHTVREQLVADDTWWTQHIIAIGNRIIIKVNDKIVTDFIDGQHTYSSGLLALEHLRNRPGTVTMFRNTMVKRLPDNEAEAWSVAKKDIPEILVSKPPLATNPIRADIAPGSATKDHPWTNSLGMPFVPVPLTEVLFCIWDTRLQDYQPFADVASGVWTKPSFPQGPTHPVVNISWEDAKSFHCHPTGI